MSCVCRWLLFAALVLGAAAGVLGGAVAPTAAVARAAARHGGASAALRRLAVSIVTGSLVGLYIALEVVPRQTALQVCMLCNTDTHTHAHTHTHTHTRNTVWFERQPHQRRMGCTLP